MPTRRKNKVEIEGRCRLCEGDAMLTCHHLVPESWFRRKAQTHRHDPANIVPLCKHCHRLIEGDVAHPDRRARRDYARWRLRNLLLPEELAFVRTRRGQAWLDHHYPAHMRQHARPTAAGTDRPLVGAI